DDTVGDDGARREGELLKYAIVGTPSLRLGATSALQFRSGELISVPATSFRLASKARSDAVSMGFTTAGCGRAGGRAGALPPPILSRSSTEACRSAVMLGRPDKPASIEPSSVWPFRTTVPL